MVRITNYRKTGETFVNMLSMRSVVQSDGVARYNVGLQFTAVEVQKGNLKFLEAMLQIVDQTIVFDPASTAPRKFERAITRAVSQKHSSASQSRTTRFSKNHLHHLNSLSGSERAPGSVYNDTASSSPLAELLAQKLSEPAEGAIVNPKLHPQHSEKHPPSSRPQTGNPKKRDTPKFLGAQQGHVPRVAKSKQGAAKPSVRSLGVFTNTKNPANSSLSPSPPSNSKWSPRPRTSPSRPMSGRPMTARPVTAIARVPDSPDHESELSPYGNFMSPSPPSSNRSNLGTLRRTKSDVR